MNAYRTLAVGLAALLVLSTMGGVVTAAGTTDLTVTPADQEIAPGETTTVAVAVTDADGGVGASDLGVSVTDPSVATITNVEISGGPAASFTNVSIAGDGSEADVDYFSADTADSGEITILTVTLEAQSAGTTDIEVGPSTGQPAAVVYDESGAGYTLASIGSATLTVTDPNTAPTSSIDGPSSAQVGETVSFDASDSSDDDGSIASYAWDFGDGATDTGESVTHTYDSSGDYTVSVTVTDDDGATDTATQTVSVSEPTQTDPASFQVSNLNAPDNATQGENITVSADVANDGDEGATQTVEFRLDGDGDGILDGDETLTSQEVTLDGDETKTVTFSDLDTSGLAPEDYTHGVFTDDDSATATITIEEPDTPASETSVSLSPDSSEVVIGETETYDVVVDDADGGVGAYELTVSLDNASVASIIDVTIDGDTDFTDVSYAENDSSVTITTALRDTDDTGSVSIASVTVEGTAEGSSGLSVDVEALGTEAGESYIVTGENGASVSVIELPPVGDFQNPPTDPDGDGLYEDVNGDGEFNINDVQALFSNQDDETIQNNPDKFDFNGDGVVNVVDVQKLFNEALL